MHISIIVPIFNEGNIIKSNIKKIIIFFEKNYKFEIIIVDDGSSDDTKIILDSLNDKRIKILSNKKNKGKGYSIKKGIEASLGNVILTTDADLSAEIAEFNKLILKYNRGYSFVIGSRSKENSVINIKQNFLRISLGIAFNVLVKIILGLKYSDTQCGFKLYDSIKIKSIIHLCRVDKFCADVEILYLAKKNNISVYEEGIIWNDNKNSKVRLLNDPINMFFDLLRIKFRKY
tara:strand:+ start:1989 stop:2684 length:696 start_codon:yes stop_codon:yes gene_type:complete